VVYSGRGIKQKELEILNLLLEKGLIMVILLHMNALQLVKFGMV
jgi:hypothetical protein